MKRALTILGASIALLGVALAGAVADEMADVRKILADALQTATAAPDDVWETVLLFSIASAQEKIGDQAGAARTSAALRQVTARS